LDVLPFIRRVEGLITTLSVENIPVGSLPIKSLPVKILSTRGQNGKLSTDKVAVGSQSLDYASMILPVSLSSFFNDYD
jgi:hypothetical protein